MATIKQLKTQINKLQREANKIYAKQQKLEIELEEKRYPEYIKLVGKCFVYQNSYGGGYGKSWSLYIKVTSFKDGCYTIIKAQKDCDGKSEVKTDFMYKSFLEENEGYKPITEEEFQGGLDVILDDLEKLRVEIRYDD